jgi:hypothetical protein
MDLRIHITILVTVARCTGSLVGTLTSTLLAVNRTLNASFMTGAANQLTATCTTEIVVRVLRLGDQVPHCVRLLMEWLQR